MKRSENFSMRMTTELRGRINRDAEARGLSAADAVVDRLERSFADESASQRKLAGKINQAFGDLVARLAEHIEWDTQLSWKADAYTRVALIAGIEQLLSELPKYQGQPSDAIPEVPPKLAEYYRTSPPPPEEHGRFIASSLLAQVSMMRQTPIAREGMHMGDSFFLFPRLKLDLGFVERE